MVRGAVEGEGAAGAGVRGVGIEEGGDVGVVGEEDGASLADCLVGEGEGGGGIDAFDWLGEPLGARGEEAVDLGKA